MAACGLSSPWLDRGVRTDALIGVTGRTPVFDSIIMSMADPRLLWPLLLCYEGFYALNDPERLAFLASSYRVAI